MNIVPHFVYAADLNDYDGRRLERNTDRNDPPESLAAVNGLRNGGLDYDG